MSQIDNRHYADWYLADRCTIVKVGVEFSSSERNITAWTEDIISKDMG